ncbi:hypothetical protein EYA84_17885 [Verrucosispora sp. SN26_14.1]|nr:hypothetical protein EYA84_17885 [Verrucosispora sp. SN26_14.1]
MHPHDPYRQPPHQQQPYPPQQHPPQLPPVVFVQQRSNRATTTGVWAIFFWIAGPVLLALCCAGCLFSIFGGALLGGDYGGSSPSPTP